MTCWSRVNIEMYGFRQTDMERYVYSYALPIGRTWLRRDCASMRTYSEFSSNLCVHMCVLPYGLGLIIDNGYGPPLTFNLYIYIERERETGRVNPSGRHQ